MADGDAKTPRPKIANLETALRSLRIALAGDGAIALVIRKESVIEVLELKTAPLIAVGLPGTGPGTEHVHIGLDEHHENPGQIAPLCAEELVPCVRLPGGIAGSRTLCGPCESARMRLPLESYVVIGAGASADEALYTARRNAEPRVLAAGEKFRAQRMSYNLYDRAPRGATGDAFIENRERREDDGGPGSPSYQSHAVGE